MKTEPDSSWDEYPRQLALDNYKRLYLIEKQLIEKDKEIERLQAELDVWNKTALDIANMVEADA